MWEDLPESERCDRRRGQSGERRSLVAPTSGLLPASQVLQNSVNLFFFAESLKERQQVQQLCVIHIVKPGLDWHLRRRGGEKNKKQRSLTPKKLIQTTFEGLTAFSGWKM